MAIILDGVTLSQHMIWEDQFVDDQVAAQSTTRTLGGKLVVYSQQLNSGRPITLVAREDQGWLTKTQVEGVSALARVAGAIYLLTIGSESFNVMFRHHDPPAFSATPLIYRTNSASTDYFTAVIKLFVVN